jgi:hypothetical protein
MEKKDGASVSEEKEQRRAAAKARKAQKKADRIERRKYGTIWTRKGRKKKMALAARQKERAKESLEEVASKKTNQAVGYTESESSSVSMKKPDMSRPAKKLEYIQGSSMGYGKKHGSSMNKYDKKMMHLREQISDDKKAIHRTDQAKKSHAHPIFKHMRKF